MCVWNNHHVAAGVRIDVEDDKVKLGPMKNEILFVGGRVVQDIAENATAGFDRVIAGYVVISPRTPK